MPLFLTGLITTDHAQFPPFPYSGRSWKLHLVSTKASSRLSETSTTKGGGELSATGMEVAIEARDAVAAQRAAFLLDAASNCWDGCGSHGYDRRGLVVTPITEAAVARDTHSRTMIPLECHLAARASWRLARVYAMTKLWMSYRVLPFDSSMLAPSRDIVGKSAHPVDQVRYATGIVLAYAVMEELGLEVRASPKKPSTVNGQWNPEVKADLEHRLTSARVDILEPVNWHVRGVPTRLERDRPTRAIKRSPWAHWKIRDVEVSLVDAIAHVSWLRSKVSAHRTHVEYARVLSVYDLANAQFVARRLLLESLGCWNIKASTVDLVEE